MTVINITSSESPLINQITEMSRQQHFKLSTLKQAQKHQQSLADEDETFPVTSDASTNTPLRPAGASKHTLCALISLFCLLVVD